jgi:hypothetical protein
MQQDMNSAKGAHSTILYITFWVGLPRSVLRTLGPPERYSKNKSLCDEKLFGVGNLPGRFVVASCPLRVPTLLVDAHQPSSSDQVP